MVLQLWPEGAEPGSGVQRFVMAANWQRGFEVKFLYFENSIVYFWVPP